MHHLLLALSAPEFTKTKLAVTLGSRNSIYNRNVRTPDIARKLHQVLGQRAW